MLYIYILLQGYWILTLAFALHHLNYLQLYGLDFKTLTFILLHLLFIYMSYVAAVSSQSHVNHRQKRRKHNSLNVDKQKEVAKNIELKPSKHLYWYFNVTAFTL